MLLSIQLLLLLSYCIATAIAAIVPSSASLGRPAPSNTSDSLLTINLFNASKGECRMNGERLHLDYTELGDNIKRSNFVRLMYHVNRSLVDLMQATHAHWDDRIGVQPIVWGTRDYWFCLDDMNVYFYGITWFWLQALFGLLDWCYEKGQNLEFEAKLYYDSRKVGRVRVYFHRVGERLLESG